MTGSGRDPSTFPAGERAVNWNGVHSPVEQIEAAGLRGLAQELVPQRLSVNALCPGTIDTVRMDVLGREAQWQQVLQSIPMQWAASDEEVAGLIVYLCSPIAEDVPGQSMYIDGGAVMW